MGHHHVALATGDLAAAHELSPGPMGFELVKAAVAATESPGGWAKLMPVFPRAAGRRGESIPSKEPAVVDAG